MIDIHTAMQNAIDAARALDTDAFERHLDAMKSALEAARAQGILNYKKQPLYLGSSGPAPTAPAPKPAASPWRELSAPELFQRAMDATNRDPDAYRTLGHIESLAQDALASAATGGDLGAVRLLTRLASPEGSFALERAAHLGRFEIVQELAPLCSEKTRAIALTHAAEAGRVQTVKALLSLTQDPERQNTALGLAAREGHLACVELLLPGCDQLAIDTALASAARQNHAGCVAALAPFADAGRAAESALPALLGGRLDALEALMALIGAIDIPDDALWTSLIEALRPDQRDKPRCAVFLAEELSARGSRAPNHALPAAAQGRGDFGVRLLLPLSDPAANDSQALRHAARVDNQAAFELLLPLSNPNALECQALVWACERDNRAIALALLAVCDLPGAELAEARARAGGHFELAEAVATRRLALAEQEQLGRSLDRGAASRSPGPRI